LFHVIVRGKNHSLIWSHPRWLGS